MPLKQGENRKPVVATVNIIFIACGYALTFWLAEAFLYSLLTDDCGFLQRVMLCDKRALSTRIPSLILFLIFGLHIQFTISRRKKANAAVGLNEKQSGPLTPSPAPAGRIRNEFFANLSHEIRTPLNAILGLAGLMLDKDLSDDIREDLEVMMSAGYTLLSVINDILDFSKIEAGKFVLEEKAFQLRDCVWDALRIISASAHEKGVELAYEVAPDVPDGLMGDPLRLRQILLNLVGNAVKFTDTGEIIVSVQLQKTTDTHAHLLFFVSDTGRGIAIEKQKNIFRAFEQADSSASGNPGGTGLGLYICAKLVELMGGTIGVESQSGRGCTFQFTSVLTLPEDRVEPEKSLSADDLNGLKALVVDDNHASCRIIDGMLAEWGIVSKTVHSAAQAQQMLAQDDQKNDRFDLILIDSDMPEEDGFSLVRWIKSKEITNSCVVMMLTRIHRRSRDGLRHLGVKGSLMKPIRASDLIKTVNKALAIKRIEISKPSAAQEKLSDEFSYSIRILVAEDTTFNQRYMSRLLEHWGHQAVIVDNGRMALDALDRDDFDMIFLDVQMPEMDGFETISKIRELEGDSQHHIPVVAMTAHAFEGDKTRCLEAGMDAYVPKPIAPDYLLSTMDALLSDSVKASSARVVPEKQSLPLDRRGLLRAFANDVDFFRESVSIFAGEYPKMMATIREAIKKKDGALLRRSAHGLKGMLYNFQAIDAAKKAFSIEQMGVQETFDKAGKACDSLDVDLVTIDKHLQEMARED